ncbi:MAG: hypothetical protein R2832_19750, partial [Rhodothermales bacterium]
DPVDTEFSGTYSINKGLIQFATYPSVILGDSGWYFLESALGATIWPVQDPSTNYRLHFGRATE